MLVDADHRHGPAVDEQRRLTHYCFVRSGSLIAAVDVDVHGDGSFSLVDFGPTDASTVSALRQALAAGYSSGN